MLPKYKRILLKLSGEALIGQSTTDPFDPKVIEQYAYDIKEVINLLAANMFVSNFYFS